VFSIGFPDKQLTVTARHLRDADTILVLGHEGTLLEQGNLESLNMKSDYVQKLFMEQQQVKKSSAETVIENLPISAQEHKTDEVAMKVTESTADLRRKTGDIQLYKYYFKSIGWAHGIVLVGLVFGAEFCSFFPRMCQSPHFPNCLILCRNLDQNMGGRRNKASRKQTRNVLWRVFYARCYWLDFHGCFYRVSSVPP
jgi:hypothetical protein